MATRHRAAAKALGRIIAGRAEHPGEKRWLLHSSRRGLVTGAARDTFAGLRGLRSSNDLLASPTRTRLMQERLAEEGYLLFRDLLDRAKVLALRRRIAAALRDLQWIDAQQPSDLGTLVQAAPGDSVTMDPHDWPIFDRVQKMPEFHALPHDPQLLSTLEALFGESVLMHPRHICRCSMFF
jgi:hypothetical protein